MRAPCWTTLPVNLPSSSGITSLTALAAPVVVGMMFDPTARPKRLLFFENPSRMCWELVDAWTVVIIPYSIPKEC